MEKASRLQRERERERERDGKRGPRDSGSPWKKGYIMKVFPRNPEKRAKWAANVGRLKFDAMTISGFC
ncbi:hypothetical protein ALC62_14767 [Cyphomyrmex costatus]|uniref:THAP-type domain-containing protein n=1 Tax=Cyphomyrmex costatus TaxID=456900 RepID=A0A151I8E9_9HYME|nr:hypothetical protein ALC62_14767 [Cyphomyrmex costatus]